MYAKKSDKKTYHKNTIYAKIPKINQIHGKICMLENRKEQFHEKNVRKFATTNLGISVLEIEFKKL